MANVNIEQQPPILGGVGIHAGHSPVVLEFSTELTGSANQNAFLSFRVTSPVIVGDTFVFHGTTYTASNDPGAGEFLTTTASTTGQVIESIARMLQDDPDVNYAYLFEPNTATSTIAITAILPGTQWNIPYTLPSPFVFLFLLSGQDSTRGMQFPDYMVWVEVFVNPFVSFANPSLGTTGNTLEGLLMKPYLASNRMTFDLSAYVQSMLEVSKPDLALGLFLTVGNWVQYSWRYGEQYTRPGFTNPLRTQIGQSGSRYALKSALPNNDTTNLLPYYQTSRNWLTNQRTNRLIQPMGDYDWLYFIWYDVLPATGAKFLALSLRITWIDGTQFDAGRFFSAQGVDGVYGVRVDPDAFGMPAIELLQNKVVASYQINLVQSSSPAFTSFSIISEAFTFVIDRKCNEYAEYPFVWLEPIGSFAGYTFRGITKTTPERAAQVMLRSVDLANPKSSNQVRATRQVDFSVSYQTFSGLVDKATFDWLRDSLFSSPCVFVIIDDELHAVIVTGTNAEDQSDQDTAGVSITWQFTQPNNTIAQ